MTSTDDSATAETETPLPLLELRDPLPAVVADDMALHDVCEQLAAGSGPIALDAERASGYRYSQRAYLIQLRRAGAGTALIDPVGLDDFAELDATLADSEWILHAATQDLPCLRELDLVPRALFDTELAGRLLNLPRVGLASLVEHFLGQSLAKEHSAVDWSTRPLPEPWLQYAALDVEVLIELRDHLDKALIDAGKREWATQEFEGLLDFTGPKAKTDRWRRTSGMHKVRGGRNLALVRELWTVRDQIAADRDITPSKVLPDAAIVEIANKQPTSRSLLRGLPTLRHRGARRYLDEWLEAVERGLALSEDDLPRKAASSDGPPPPRQWADKNPAAADRLGNARALVTEIAEKNNLPAENLITPDTVRRLAWEPPAPLSTNTVRLALSEYGARPWQSDLLADGLADALDHPDT